MLTILRHAALAVIALAMFVPGPAWAQWLRAETDHFIIYGETSERALRTYAEKVERFDFLLRSYYPIAVDHEIPKLEIYLADGRRDMLQAEPGISASVGGFYSPNSSRIHAVVNTESRMGDHVMFHEYGHHFMFQMAGAAYPSWFVEGFAEYYATADIRPDRIQFGRHSEGRMLMFVQQPVNSWAPMADVLRWRISDSGRYRAGDYYAQAWGLTHYFMSTPERTRMLGQYLAAVSRGEDSVAAMQAATGRTPEQLQNDMRLYLGGTIQYHTPQIEVPTPKVEITRLSPSESQLAWLDLRLDREPITVEPLEPREGESERARAQREEAVRENAEFRAELIRDALAAGERHRDSRLGLLVKARAHRLEGRSHVGFEVLEPVLTADESDPETLRLAAELLLDLAKAEADPVQATGHRREAVAYLGRALDADPLDFRIYRALNESRAGERGYPSDNDLKTLEVGSTLAPQSFDMRMRLAQAYMARGLHAEAMAIVLPVANNPHGGSWARRAKALVALAQTAMGQAADPVEEAPVEDAPAEDAEPSDAVVG
jgi:tetratricopeptide (TPR) repeat protein